MSLSDPGVTSILLNVMEGSCWGETAKPVSACRGKTCFGRVRPDGVQATSSDVVSLATLDGIMAKSLVTVQTTPLDEAAISDLLYMLEEEKLAGDIYEAFYDLYGTTVFDQIAASEDSHYAALVGQADLIGLDISAIEATPAGEYLNDDLQALYDALLDWGSTSEADALLVEPRQVLWGRLPRQVHIALLRQFVHAEDLPHRSDRRA